jgi:hypothetical protein
MKIDSYGGTPRRQSRAFDVPGGDTADAQPRGSRDRRPSGGKMKSLRRIAWSLLFHVVRAEAHTLQASTSDQTATRL